MLATHWTSFTMPATVPMMPEEMSTVDPHAECTALLAALPGCEIVAHVDLSARTVLCAKTARRLPQERLDALCNWAADVLGTGAKIAFAVDDTALWVARRLAHLEAGGAGGEGLCLLLPPSTDPARVLVLVSTGGRE